MTEQPQHPEHADHAKLTELLARMVDGELTDAERKRLALLVESDPEAKRRYARFVMVHAMMRQELRDHESPIPLTRGEDVPTRETVAAEETAAERVAGRIGWTRFAAAAAVLITVGLVVALMQGRSDDGDSGAGLTPTGPVAVIADTAGAVSADAALQVGTELDAGRVSVSGGRVSMVMRRGAALAVSGPASVDLLGENRCEVRAGRVTAFVPPSAVGFRADLPNDLFVVDLGTEFALRVAPDGASEVHVFDGVVELRGEAAHVHPLKLKAGQAMRIDARGRRARGVADATDFSPRRRDLEIANADFSDATLPADTPWLNVAPVGWMVRATKEAELGLQRNNAAPDTLHLFWNEPSGELVATVDALLPAAGMTITLTCDAGGQNVGAYTLSPKLLVGGRVVASRTETIRGAGEPVESASVPMLPRTVRYTTTKADVGKPIGVRLAFGLVAESIQARVDRVSLTIGGDDQPHNDLTHPKE